MTERVLQTFGKIDVLINNAGWDELKPFLQTTPDFWKKIIVINYRTELNTCYAVLTHMVTRKAGAVVSISSDAGRVSSAAWEKRSMAGQRRRSSSFRGYWLASTRG
jgi:2-hydroxycyclohexanecarboxyl-CoA dehydrogenase